MRGAPDKDTTVSDEFLGDGVEFRMCLARTGCLDQQEKYVLLRFLLPARFFRASDLIENWPDDRDPEDLKYKLLDLIGDTDDRF